MAFPGTYNFNYYKGDTFEFNIYPKKTDGSVFDLTDYFTTEPSYEDDAGQNTSLPYETARFYYSTARGSAGVATRHECFAMISDDKQYIKCAIRPQDSAGMSADTTYVYDVEVKKPSSGGTNGYDIIHTLLTGTITVTDQVTGAV